MALALSMSNENFTKFKIIVEKWVIFPYYVISRN